ncbi:MAG: hypothetical protein WB950_15705, partial [Acidobacteriaceae bacterium]
HEVVPIIESLQRIFGGLTVHEELRGKRVISSYGAGEWNRKSTSFDTTSQIKFAFAREIDRN